MAKGYAQGQQRRMTQAAPSNPLAIKTKKYALDKNTFIKLNMTQMIKNQWYWGFVPLALIFINAILNFTGIYHNYWIYVLTILGALIYVAFWAVQFTGVTQLEQYKQLFEKYRYEIDSRQVFMKLNDQEGAMIKWDMIKTARKDKDAYILDLGQYQFVYLPFAIFTNDNDRKLMDKILRDKGYITAV